MPIRQSPGIKEVIQEHPAVAAILQEYGIECATCSVGICQLKDVVDIHSLADEQACSLMARIETVMSGEMDDVDLVAESATKPSSYTTGTLSDGVMTLIREHTFIKRFISVVANITSQLDLTIQADQVFAGNCLEFITCYADKLHHGKEEEILFRYFDTTEEIFQAMFEEHTRGRTLVGLMRHSIAEQDTRNFTRHFLEYRDVLEEHINKEDDILFPWLDRRLTDEQKQEMNATFVLSDRQSEVDAKRLEDFVDKLEGG